VPIAGIGMVKTEGRRFFCIAKAEIGISRNRHYRGAVKGERGQGTTVFNYDSPQSGLYDGGGPSPERGMTGITVGFKPTVSEGRLLLCRRYST